MVKFAHRSEGFSLIELLLVIIIVGALSTVIILALNPGRRLARTRDVGRKSDVNKIVLALQSYYTLIRQYPLPPGAPGGLTELVNNQDLKVLPIGPTGENYNYDISNGGSVSAEAAVYIALEAPTTPGAAPGNIAWCWTSTAAKTYEVPVGDCTP